MSRELAVGIAPDLHDPQDDRDRLATENLAMLPGERAASQTYIGTHTATM